MVTFGQEAGKGRNFFFCKLDCRELRNKVKNSYYRLFFHGICKVKNISGEVEIILEKIFLG